MELKFSELNAGDVFIDIHGYGDTYMKIAECKETDNTSWHRFKNAVELSSGELVGFESDYVVRLSPSVANVVHNAKEFCQKIVYKRRN